MKLLDFTQKLYKEIDLSDYSLITCHHILEIDYLVIKALCENGLKPEKIYVLGKPYSTSKEVLQKYKELGVYVDGASLIIDPNKSFDNYFESVISNFIVKVSENISGKVIVWDDGGLLNTQLNNSNNLPFNIVSSVEQTSSGFNKLADTVLNFPIVNMARSKAKLQFESLFIADKNIQRLAAYRHTFQKDIKSALIIGGGPIGQVMKGGLVDMNIDVKIYDRDIEVSDYDTDIKLVHVISGFDVIIGATGEQALTVDDLSVLKNGCVLLSVSSSDREFDAVGWRKKAGITDSSVHKDILLDGRVLLNNGFPLNFTGEPESVPLKYIQLTGALTLAAIYTGVQLTEDNNDWVDIPQDKQEKIINEFKSYGLIK